jgi:hypothetical protein
MIPKMEKDLCLKRHSKFVRMSPIHRWISSPLGEIGPLYLENMQDWGGQWDLPLAYLAYWPATKAFEDRPVFRVDSRSEPRVYIGVSLR